MAVVISGVLKDGAGKPVAGRTIQLKAKRTSPTVVVNILSSSITGADGSYRIEAEPGYYNVSMLREGLLPVQVGEIYVAPNSAPDTLNAFLDAPKDADLRPEVMKRFEEMVNHTAALCEEAEREREMSQNSAKEAQDSAGQSAKSEQDAADSAGEADKSAEDAAESARLAAQSKESAATSEQNAKDSEKAAAQSAENAADAIANAFQSDIRGRTPGKIPLPGAFGFGTVFTSADSISLDASKTFEQWVRTAFPGRYRVSESGIKTIPGVVFNGVVDVICPDIPNPGTQPQYMVKFIVFYGVNGDLWMNRYWTASNGYLIGWENLKLKSTHIADMLSSSTGNDWGDPDVCGLIIAAYQGTSDSDKNIKVERGKVYPGSRLGPVGISASYVSGGTYSSSATFYVTGCGSHSLPGAYRALSGVTTTYGDKAFIALFIRAA
ncbi:prophage tail fiber N-terminal domain-containing protein [Citrobacter freundii]